jgi:hypothetical protein
LPIFQLLLKISKACFSQAQNKNHPDVMSGEPCFR